MLFFKLQMQLLFHSNELVRIKHMVTKAILKIAVGIVGRSNPPKEKIETSLRNIQEALGK